MAKTATKPVVGKKALVDNPKGLPIVDSKRDVVLEIAAKHIKRAKPMDPTGCAAAICCTDTHVGVVKATINKAIAYLEYSDKILRFTVPNALSREIIAFDRSAPFAEGRYCLKAPNKASRLGRKQPGKPRTTEDGSRGPLRQQRHVTVMVRGA